MKLNQKVTKQYLSEIFEDMNINEVLHMHFGGGKFEVGKKGCNFFSISLSYEDGEIEYEGLEKSYSEVVSFFTKIRKHFNSELKKKIKSNSADKIEKMMATMIDDLKSVDDDMGGEMFVVQEIKDNRNEYLKIMEKFAKEHTLRSSFIGDRKKRKAFFGFGKKVIAAINDKGIYPVQFLHSCYREYMDSRKKSYAGFRVY